MMMMMIMIIPPVGVRWVIISVCSDNMSVRAVIIYPYVAIISPCVV